MKLYTQAQYDALAAVNDQSVAEIARLEAEVARYKMLYEATTGQARDHLVQSMAVTQALEVAECYGQIDGAHHKAWAIDQIVRALTGDDYEAWVHSYCNSKEYEWDTGIAP